MKFVKNFYVEVGIDGHKNKLKGGPKSGKGGLRIIIKQRKKGSVSVGATIVGKLSKCGKSLGLEITTPGGTKKTVWTER